MGKNSTFPCTRRGDPTGFVELNEISRKVSDVTGRCCRLVIEKNKKQNEHKRYKKEDLEYLCEYYHEFIYQE